MNKEDEVVEVKLLMNVRKKNIYTKRLYPNQYILEIRHKSGFKRILDIPCLADISNESYIEIVKDKNYEEKLLFYSLKDLEEAE